MVIGIDKQLKKLVVNEDELEILIPLRNIMIKKGTLASFFGLIGKKR